MLNRHGEIEVFARGIDGVLCHKSQTAPNSTVWDDWESLGAPRNLKLTNLLVATRLAISRDTDGDIVVFVGSSDGSVWQIWYKNQDPPDVHWSQWEPLDGVIQNVIGVQLNQDGRVELFSEGTDEALWHNYQLKPGKYPSIDPNQIDGGPWSGWQSLGGPIGGIIALPMFAAVNQDGRLEVFAGGTDGALWHRYQTAPNDGWSGWESLGGTVKDTAVAIWDSTGRLHVFAGLIDGSVGHIFQTVPNRGPWSPWESIGGTITGPLKAAPNADGRIEVFTRGLDGGLWHNWELKPGTGSWIGTSSGWNPLGGVIAGDMTVMVNADYRIEVLVEGTDGGLWHNYQVVPNGNWSGWDSNTLGIIPFINFGREVVVQPSGTKTPTNVADLVNLVKSAEANNQRIHAFGSGWSFSDCAVTNDILFDTRLLKRPIQTVQEALSATFNGDPNLLFHVEAGINVRELYVLLDNFKDAAGNSRPLAVQAMGGSSGQTLAGAISTGTHGGDKSFQLFRFQPPLADSVLAIHLVGTGGTEYWIEPSQGITDPAKIRQYVAPTIANENIIYDDATFNATLVSLGCMGVIYSLVLQVRDQYSLIETTTATTWKGFQSKFFTNINDPANRFLQAVISPYVDGSGDATCMVTTRIEALPQTGKPDRLNPGDSLGVNSSLISPNGRFTFILQGDGNLVLYWTNGPPIWGAGTNGKSVAKAIMQGDGNLVMYGPNGEYVWDTATDGHPGAFLVLQNDGNVVIYDPAGNPLWSTGTWDTSCKAGSPKKAVEDMVHEMVTTAPGAGFAVAGILQSPGDQNRRLTEAINYILESAPGLRPILIKHYPNILQAILPEATCGGKSYEVADLTNRGAKTSMSSGAYSIEIAVQAYDSQDNLTFATFVNDLLAAVTGAANTFLAGWVSLRFTGRSRASLAMQQWPLTCHVEVSTVEGVDGLRALLSTIQNLGYGDGGLPHIGQLVDVTPATGGAIFPLYNEWRDAYQRISKGKQTFANALSERWMLTTPPPAPPPPPPEVQAIPARIVFHALVLPTVDVPFSESRNLVIRNNRSIQLSITGASIDNPFSLLDSAGNAAAFPISVAPSGSATFQVEVNMDPASSSSGSLTLNTDDLNLPKVTIPLLVSVVHVPPRHIPA